MAPSSLLPDLGKSYLNIYADHFRIIHPDIDRRVHYCPRLLEKDCSTSGQLSFHVFDPVIICVCGTRIGLHRVQAGFLIIGDAVSVVIRSLSNGHSHRDSSLPQRKVCCSWRWVHPGCPYHKPSLPC